MHPEEATKILEKLDEIEYNLLEIFFLDGVVVLKGKELYESIRSAKKRIHDKALAF